MCPSYTVRNQRGFLIPLALVLVVGISFLAIAISRFSGQTAVTITSEGLSTQAFYAAESGAQVGMHRLFYNVSTRAAVDARCTALNNYTLSFSVVGLSVCAATLNCSVSTDTGNTTSFYTINSFGRCGSGDLVGERIIEVSAYMQ